MMNESFPFNIEADMEAGVASNGTQPNLDLDSIKFIIELGQLSNRDIYFTLLKHGGIG